MADDTVQGILEGLKIAESRRQAYLRAQIDREQIQVENQRTLEAAKQAQDRLREEQRQFNAQHDLAVKAADLVKRAKQLEFMKQEADLSPAAILERKHAEVQPQLEANLKEIEAQGTQQRLNIGASGEQARMTDAANFPREQWLTEFKEANANYRARLAADTNLSEAMLRMSTESAVDTDALMSYYQGMADGTYNQDDIRKMLTPKQAVQLFGAAAKTKIVPLKKQQTDQLSELSVIKDTLRLANEFITLQPQTTGNVPYDVLRGGWQLGTDDRLRGAHKRLKSMTFIAAQLFAKQPGRALSDQDRKAYQEGQIPSLFNSKANNLILYNNMKKAALNLFNSITSNLSDEQKKLVMENFDLTDIVTGPKQSEIKILKVEPAQ